MSWEMSHAGLDAEVHPTAYWAFPELSFSFMTVVLARTATREDWPRRCGRPC